MANNVQFTINIEGLTEEQFDSQIKTEIFKRKNYSGEEYDSKEFVEIEHQPFMNNVEKSFDKDGYLINSYDWYCSNVGAKWCIIEEIDSNYITGYTAWRQPHELVINIMEYFANMYNVELTANMTYEDEFRNFMGKQYYEMVEDNGWTVWEGDCIETDGDRLVDTFNEHYPHIDTTGEDFDWYEETLDAYGEPLYPNECLDEIADRFWETA